MTIISFGVKKPDPSKLPVIQDELCQDVVEEAIVRPEQSRWRKKRICLVLMYILVVAMGLIASALVYRQCLEKASARHRYTGYCSIPIDLREQMQLQGQLIEPNYRALPFRLTSDPEPDVQVFNPEPEDNGASLREEVDIGDDVERITVFDDGRQVNFIHDFTLNMTGIVDTVRCYTLALDPDTVLWPEQLAAGLLGGAQFDVTPVHHSARVVLPEVDSVHILPFMADHCADKPTYKLVRTDNIIIRKRSTEPAKRHYIQFSGKKVQQLEIHNLNDVLSYEQSRR